MGTFSKEGPTREQIDGTSFSMTFFAEGFSSEEAEKTGKHDTKMVTKVNGPGLSLSYCLMLHDGVTWYMIL